VIATVGTAGGTTINTPAKAGATVILVSGVEGFSTGQAVGIGEGADLETAVVAGISPGRRRFGAPGSMPADTVKLAAPLKYAHTAGKQVSGSGITLASPLTKDHNTGSQVAGYIPTPGEPNRYSEKQYPE